MVLGTKRLVLPRSAYAAKFAALDVSPTASFTWQSKAPLQCRFFGWLALKNRCWTSDHLARRGLSHQDSCPFCDKADEAMNHLMLHCVLAKEVWTKFAMATGKPNFVPAQGETLEVWCIRQDGPAEHRKTTRALCLLGMWQLWKHRNDIVFNGAHPAIATVLRRVEEEGRVWRREGLFKGELDVFFAGIAGGQRLSS